MTSCFQASSGGKMETEEKQIHIKYLTALTFLALGQDYIESEIPIYAKVTFEQARSELNGCLEIVPNNQTIRELLQKCDELQSDIRPEGIEKCEASG